uniref:PI3K/PI4K catalytic domain-containing protein n=1 Tax=Athene cunicularia TaxID=194338 RepID=A0A663MWH4_ATHCN
MGLELLRNAQNEVNFKIWCQKLLAALQFCAGKTLNNEFSKEEKAASVPKKKGLLKNISTSFFPEAKVCQLPLNPALVVQVIESCSYFMSNALPLKISFINANAPSGNINVIFKVGNDLCQDMLGLQMQMFIYNTVAAESFLMVPDATTLVKIHRESGLIGPLKENTIKKWFHHHHPLESSYRELAL